MYKWNIYNKKADFKGLSQKHEIDQVVARIMINRGVEPSDFSCFLKPSKEGLYEPALMKDMDKATKLLIDCIDSHKKIRIIGDYDIDGICATFILKTGIEKCGGDVDYAIPHRIEDGYGVNNSLIQKAIDDGREVIITCDNGISASDVIDYAKQKGLVVIVTDHHAVPIDDYGNQIIPQADAVVNPHRDDCEYPFKQICGAVVAWKLIINLYEKRGYSCRDASELIEFAAFATIGDIMPLLDENRCIVYMGLKKFCHTKNTGLRTLVSLLKLEGEPISAYHLGFILGPCFNASGRLDTAEKALALLEEDCIDKARQIASELISLNEERKAMTVEGVKEAVDTIEKNGLNKDKVLVVHIPSTHESLCGIIAGRVREKYNRPSFVLTDGENETKGSGRSIPAYSMFDKMQECKELFIRFGGHPMAAGLSISKDNIEEFRNRMNERCQLSEEDLVESVMIDAAMPISYLTTDIINQINGLEPFGNGNEKPLFANKEVIASKAEYIGKNKNYLKFTFPVSSGNIYGLYFGDSDLMKSDLIEAYGQEAWNNLMMGKKNPIRFDIAYFPQINNYKGNESIQVVIRNYRVQVS